MKEPRIEDHVRLIHDVPELELHRGEIGVVRSTWCDPVTAYEVEFEHVGLSHKMRALLLRHQIQLAGEG